MQSQREVFRRVVTFEGEGQGVLKLFSVDAMGPKECWVSPVCLVDRQGSGVSLCAPGFLMPSNLGFCSEEGQVENAQQL